jgi:cytochrome oxidase Cu insertion factor (SCO1/SenC/PrrC family)
MKHFKKNILTGVLVIIVIVAAAVSLNFGKLTPTPAYAEDNQEIKTLLQKMHMSVAADHPVMPDFELLDLDGNVVRLSQFKGETVLLGFFTTW